MPLFYLDRDRFIEVMRHTISLNGSFFNTRRMLSQYMDSIGGTLFLPGGAGEVAIVPLMDRWRGKRPVTFWTVVVAIMPLILMIAVAVLVSWRINRRRRGGLEALLQRQGFQTNFHLAKEEKAALLAPVQHLFASLDLRHAPEGFRRENAGV